MFGLGSICDKIAGEVVPEEYRWLADIGCAGLDALTGNVGGAVSLGLKAGADGAEAAGERRLSEKLSIANTAQGAVTCAPLNAPGSLKIYEMRLEPLTGSGLFDNAARNAAGVGAGAALGAAKGGSARDVREGIAIGTAASGLANGFLKVSVDPAGDARELAGNAALLGRDTAAFATAIAVAEKRTGVEKRAAGAIGGAVGAAADLPGAVAGLAPEREELERLLDVERTAADIASIAFGARAAGLRAGEGGRGLVKAQECCEAGLGLITGATEQAVSRAQEGDAPGDDASAAGGTCGSAPRTSRTPR